VGGNEGEETGVERAAIGVTELLGESERRADLGLVGGVAVLDGLLHEVVVLIRGLGLQLVLRLERLVKRVRFVLHRLQVVLFVCAQHDVSTL
jgi:hypothetical protein